MCASFSAQFCVFSIGCIPAHYSCDSDSLRLCCVYLTSDETDLDLEARQWGSWGKRMYTYMPVLESAYRSRARIENPTDICYPWLTRHDIFERTPVHITHGTHFIPEPDPDEVLAAAGLLGGYMDFPHEFPNERGLDGLWDLIAIRFEKAKPVTHRVGPFGGTVQG